MFEFKTKLGKGGRIVIPAEYRQALNLHVGDDIVLRLKAGEISLFTPDQAMQQAQALMRRYLPPGRLLSEELIAERRLELGRN
jgi:AbrB family looped-hinge helix DNA binding protein